MKNQICPNNQIFKLKSAEWIFFFNRKAPSDTRYNRPFIHWTVRG